MWKWIILALLAVAIWQWKMREGFEPTATIKAPPYDEAEIKRIEEMMSPENKKALTDMFTRDNGNQPALRTPFIRITNGVAVFYKTIYSGATEPITETQIDDFVGKLFLQPNAMMIRDFPTIKEDVAANRKALKQVLTAYFIEQNVAPPPPPPPSEERETEAVPEPPPRSYSSDFERTLDMYKTNLVKYKVSGNAGFKTASETAKKWLDEFISNVESTVEKDGEEIQSFIETNAKSDQELAKLKTDMASIRKNGPDLQMIYETEREAQREEPVDYTVYYTKGAVLAGIAGLVAVAAMF